MAKEPTGIHPCKSYVVSGEDIIKLHDRLTSVHSSLSFLHRSVKESLSSLSNDSDYLPRFIAKVGLSLALVDSNLSFFSDCGLLHLFSGLKLSELEGDKEASNA